MQIVRLNATQVESLLPQFVALIQNVVDDGASIGFMPPLGASDAEAYWRSVVSAIKENSRLLWVAQMDGVAVGTSVGTVQLDLCMKANGPHRAEVSKLMVHTSQRGKGISKALLRTLEAEAQTLGRTTLVLDTRKGDVSERLYESQGWVRGGEIPEYVISANGGLDATVVFFKLLEKQNR